MATANRERRESQRHRRLWEVLDHHAEQQRIYTCGARFRGLCCGVRSGKTLLAKRFTAESMVDFPLTDGFFVWGAPTHPQAKRIFWKDAKAIFPRSYIWNINETDRTVQIVNGCTLAVVGVNEAERLEGVHIDGVVLDERDDIVPDAWEHHIRTRLSTRGRPPGWAWHIGVPEGRRALWEMKCEVESGKLPDGAFATWPSSDIIAPEEIAHAKATMDPLVYRQEYEADFVTFAGRTYHTFDRDLHAAERLIYDRQRPLHFAFDFNVDPGTAEVCQELPYRGSARAVHPRDHGNPRVADVIDAWIGEVWLRDSRTEHVCRALLEAFGDHPSEVHCWGDYTGGSRHTSQTRGTDWDQIQEILGRAYGSRLSIHRKRNPSERARVNAVNARLLTADGKIHALVDPVTCPKLVEDFETVANKADGSGAIDKTTEKFKLYTHPTDEVGYFTYHRHPLRDRRESFERIR